MPGIILTSDVQAHKQHLIVIMILPSIANAAAVVFKTPGFSSMGILISL